MPGEAPDPKMPPEGTPPTTNGGAPPTFTSLDATIEQGAPPAWALSGGASGSNVSRSGKEVYELDREIERSQAEGAGDAAEGYTLIRKLGTGSFGTVWEAEDGLTGERVAIKFFTAGDSDWEKLLGEVGLLQAVEGCHGIVMVKQVRPGAGGRRPHYVMQLANSGSLADWLKTAASLPPRERVRQAVEFFVRAARAMAAVHRRGIHHCDLKPHNILLHRADPGAPPEPLVADFGQAHLATDDTPALGTYFYMPPDQIDAAQAGTPPDTRWDVYALGAVMYEMLTGEPPRRGAELLDRIKKAPKHLPTRMAVYREGLLAAEPPEAHRKIADPVLAKIIDRCLSLRPEKRPPDAGALVSLLDARARWRRIRPVLGLAAGATLLLILLMASAGLWGARVVQRESEQNVAAELTSSLARTAGYSAPAIERRLKFHVKKVEATAGEIPREVRQALAGLSRTPRGAQFDPASVPAADRAACAAWLRHVVTARKDAGFNADSIASVTLVMVTDSDTPGGSRGFVVARAHPDGTTEDFTHTNRPDVYSRDFSFRDYFHGQGSLVGEEGKPHPVIRATHICNPYRARGVDRTSKGEPIPQPWKVDVVTPIWEAESGSRVVGLLRFGLNLERDVVAALEPVSLGAKGSERFGIASKVKVVLVDDRDQWVWHPDAKGRLGDHHGGPRLPHDYAALARARGLDPDQVLPWRRMRAPEGDRKFGYLEDDRYVDLVEDEREAHRNRDQEIACFARFRPYAESKYPEARGRQWVFIAEVDRATALRPLDEMRDKIVRIGAIVGAALALLVAGLWIGLVAVLRRLEFVSHG